MTKIGDRTKQRDITDELTIASGIELLKGKWIERDGKFVLPINGSFEQKVERAADIRRALEHLDIMNKSDPQFTNTNPDTSLSIYVSADNANGNNELIMNPEQHKQLQDALKFVAQMRR